MYSVFDGLHSAIGEAQYYSNSSDTFTIALLQEIDKIDHLLHLRGIGERSPRLLNYGSMSIVRRKRRRRIRDVKPPLVLALQGSLEMKPKVQIGSPLSELKAGTPDHIGFALGWIGF